MKTSKLTLITTVITIAVFIISVSPRLSAKEDQKKQQSSTKVSYMTYEQAVQAPGILRAMYEQIESSSMPPMEAFGTARLSYRGAKLYITGSYMQWYFFFKDQFVYRKNHQQ